MALDTMNAAPDLATMSDEDLMKMLSGPQEVLQEQKQQEDLSEMSDDALQQLLLTMPVEEEPFVEDQDLSQLSDRELQVGLASTPEDPEEEETSFAEDVGIVSKDMAIQALNGIRNGLIEIGELGVDLYGAEKGATPREMFPEAETAAGAVASDVSRFITGYTVGGAPLKGIGALAGAGRYVNALLEGSVRGFVGDYAVTSDEDKTLGNMAQEYGADNMLVNTLAVHEDDSLHVKKLKNATEGVLLGSILETGFEGARQVWKYETTSKKLGKAIDEEFDNAAEQYTAVISDQGRILMEETPRVGAQGVMDDIQAKQIEEIVDQKMAMLKEARAAFEEEEALFKPLKTGDSLATRKEIHQDLNVAKKESKRLDKEITKATKELEKATNQLEKLPIPKDVVLKENQSGVVTALTDESTNIADSVRVGDSPMSRIYREAQHKQARARQHLETLHGDRVMNEQSIIDNKYLLRELTEDAQAAAALRNREALAIQGPIPPQYADMVIEDAMPLAAKVDVTAKAKSPRRIDRPNARLNKELPTNEFDAVVDDLINKKRPFGKTLERLRRFGSLLFLRSADSMRTLSDVSPTAAKLANRIRFDTSVNAKKVGQYSFTESAQFMAGRYKSRLKDTLTDFLDDVDFTRSGKLTPEANLNIVRAIRGVKDDTVPERYTEAAGSIRDLLH
jgi:hypothetical protein